VEGSTKKFVSMLANFFISGYFFETGFQQQDMIFPFKGCLLVKADKHFGCNNRGNIFGKTMKKSASNLY